MSHHEINETSTVRQLIDVFELLSKESDQINILDIEKQKLHIAQLFEIIIKKEIPRQYIMPTLPKETIKHSLNQTTRTFLYYFLLIFGMFECVAGSYLFAAELFMLIPGISNPVFIMATLIFTILSSVLFYAFEVTFLKEVLGIPYDDTEFAQLIETYSEQLKTTITINQLLSTIHMQNVDSSTFDEYRELVTLLNKELRNKPNNMPSYPESTLKNILNAGVLAFGALSSIAGSYFFVKSMMMMVASSMLGTPIGWTIIALTVLSGLGYYYSMDAISMIRLAHPVYASYETLKKELNLFKEHYPDDLDSVKSTKDRFSEKKQTEEASTQTDPPSVSVSTSSMSFFKSVSSNDDNVNVLHVIPTAG